MAVIKKTLQQQIEETKTKLAALESKAAEMVLDKNSPGMKQLLSALDVVTKENNCNVIDVLKTVSRLKKLGLKLERPPRKPRETKKATKDQAEVGDVVTKRQGTTLQSK